MPEMFFAQFGDPANQPDMMTLLLIQLVSGAIWGGLMWWKLFEKAGKPGWASVVPVYQMMVLAEVAKKPVWWGIIVAVASFIPFGGLVSLVFSILLMVEVCRQFNKLDAGTIILCLLCGIGYMVIGFGDAQYAGGTDHDDHF